MNDKIFHNLETEISANYKEMHAKRKENDVLEQLQNKILENIALMLEVIRNEQGLINGRYEDMIRDPMAGARQHNLDREAKRRLTRLEGQNEPVDPPLSAALDGHFEDSLRQNRLEPATLQLPVDLQNNSQERLEHQKVHSAHPEKIETVHFEQAKVQNGVFFHEHQKDFSLRETPGKREKAKIIVFSPKKVCQKQPPQVVSREKPAGLPQKDPVAKELAEKRDAFDSERLQALDVFGHTRAEIPFQAADEIE